MGHRWISLENAHVALGTVMIVSLALTVITYPITLIWIGQPIGTAAAIAADTFATVFVVAFFGAFALAMVEQRLRANSSRP
jgi:FtsH-binding integral membrane protein